MTPANQDMELVYGLWRMSLPPTSEECRMKKNEECLSQPTSGSDIVAHYPTDFALWMGQGKKMFCHFFGANGDIGHLAAPTEWHPSVRRGAHVLLFKLFTQINVHIGLVETYRSTKLCYMSELLMTTLLTLGWVGDSGPQIPAADRSHPQ